jgi:hypothetical protein
VGRGADRPLPVDRVRHCPVHLGSRRSTSER